MIRDEFIDLLARLVADGELTELDAADLLAQFDAGEITDVPSVLPTPEAIREPKPDNVGPAIVTLLILLTARRRPLLRTLPPLTAIQLADAIQDAFQGRVTNLAKQLATGNLALAQWQGAMLDEVEQNVLQQMFLANGNEILTAAQSARLRTIIAEQGAYLQRFADQAALRTGQGAPFTEGYMANRSRQYAGVGRGEFFRSYEDASDHGDGWVWRYVAIDDKGTCSPCHNAQGYYLAGQGPYPGQICLGAGNCRCKREPEYNPIVYRSLTTH